MSPMWIPTEAEAIEMFARHFMARHGSGAATRAKEAAADLKRHGDIKGYDIWSRVAERVEIMQSTPKSAAVRKSEYALGD